MKQMLLATLLAAGGATAALAQSTAPTTQDAVPAEKGAATMTEVAPEFAVVVVSFDSALSQKFEVKRAIVDQVQEAFGEVAVQESAEALPAALEAAIVPGNLMPEAAPVSPVPEALGDLPQTVAGSHWAAVGNHLVELTPDNRIATVVYEALP